MKRPLGLALGALFAAAAGVAHAADVSPCSALKAEHPGAVVVESAEEMPAGPLTVRGPMGQTSVFDTPAACVVKGVIAPRTAPDGRTFGVRFELRLPAAWNGRFYFQGGGGLDGSVQPALGAAGSGPSALTRGYAVVSMDGGHEGPDAAFASDQQARLDFAYQAVGKTTLVAKALIRAYYQKPPTKSYFVGCSNGGREALIAVQRYPLEFDGVVAGAPGFRLSRAAVQEAFSVKELATIAPKDKDGMPDLAMALTEADLNLVSQGVLRACDAKDGLADGLISNPGACKFKASDLVCKPGQAEGCLAPQKAAVLDAIFAGAHDSQGRALYSRFYWDSGISDIGWRVWVLGIEGRMKALNITLGADSLSHYFMTPAQNARSPYEIDLDQAADAVAQTGAVNDATSTLINSFTGHGGKLILYHGVSDPVFSAADTANWYEGVQKTDASSGASVRLFLVPAMSHCGGGRATDQFDMLSALEGWVEQGKAPEQVLAKGGAALPGVSRPLCAYPAHAHYEGGEANSASSFTCKVEGR